MFLSGRTDSLSENSANHLIEQRWRQAALVLVALVGTLTLGCNPATLAFFLAPPPMFPPEFSLTSKKKDAKVAIMVGFKELETNTDLQFADRELEEVLCRKLIERFKENRSKVEVIPSYKVRDYREKSQNWRTCSPVEIGKELGVDYVIDVSLDKMTLYEKGSRQTLFRGKAEVFVAVTDVNGPEEQGPVWSKYYTPVYPRRGPEAADNSVRIFRTNFIERMGRDLCRYFAAYPSEAKYEID